MRNSRRSHAKPCGGGFAAPRRSAAVLGMAPDPMAGSVDRPPLWSSAPSDAGRALEHALAAHHAQRLFRQAGELAVYLPPPTTSSRPISAASRAKILSVVQAIASQRPSPVG